MLRMLCDTLGLEPCYAVLGLPNVYLATCPALMTPTMDSELFNDLHFKTTLGDAQLCDRDTNLHQKTKLKFRQQSFVLDLDKTQGHNSSFMYISIKL